GYGLQAPDGRLCARRALTVRSTSPGGRWPHTPARCGRSHREVSEPGAGERDGRGAVPVTGPPLVSDALAVQTSTGAVGAGCRDQTVECAAHGVDVTGAPVTAEDLRHVTCPDGAALRVGEDVEHLPGEAAGLPLVVAGLVGLLPGGRLDRGRLRRA